MRRAAFLCAGLIAAYAAYIGWAHVDGFARAARGERPLFTDFTSTYGASLLLREAPAEALYVQEAMRAATAIAGNAAYGGRLDAQQRKVGFAPWMYPPTFIAVVLPQAP